MVEAVQVSIMDIRLISGQYVPFADETRQDTM